MVSVEEETLTEKDMNFAFIFVLLVSNSLSHATLWQLPSIYLGPEKTEKSIVTTTENPIKVIYNGQNLFQDENGKVFLSSNNFKFKNRFIYQNFMKVFLKKSYLLNFE